MKVLLIDAKNVRRYIDVPKLISEIRIPKMSPIELNSEENLLVTVEYSTFLPINETEKCSLCGEEHVVYKEAQRR